MPYRRNEDELAQSKKRYYAEHPDLNPQSTWSKILETFGADEPFAQDTSSYDYRKQWAKENDAEGNPDVSLLVPEIPLNYQLEDAGNAFAGGQYEGDPRSGDERNAGTLLNALDWPLFGFEDEVMASAMSALPDRGSYDEELKRARDIQQRYGEWENPAGARNIGSGVGGFVGAMAPYNLLVKGVGGLTGAARSALGLTPEATTTVGKFGKDVVDAGAAGGADFGLWGYGSGEGDQRTQNLEDDFGQGATLGALFPVLGGMGRAGKSAVKTGAKAAASGAKRVVRRFAKGAADEAPPTLAKRKPKSAAPGMGSQRPTVYTETTASASGLPRWKQGRDSKQLRDTLKANMATSAAKGSHGGALPIGALATGGAIGGVLGMNELERRRQEYLRRGY